MNDPIQMTTDNTAERPRPNPVAVLRALANSPFVFPSSFVDRPSCFADWIALECDDRQGSRSVKGPRRRFRHPRPARVVQCRHGDVARRQVARSETLLQRACHPGRAGATAALYNLGRVRAEQGVEELKKSPAAGPTAARGRRRRRGPQTLCGTRTLPSPIRMCNDCWNPTSRARGAPELREAAGGDESDGASWSGAGPLAPGGGRLQERRGIEPGGHERAAQRRGHGQGDRATRGQASAVAPGCDDDERAEPQLGERMRQMRGMIPEEMMPQAPPATRKRTRICVRAVDRTSRSRHARRRGTPSLAGRKPRSCWRIPARWQPSSAHGQDDQTEPRDRKRSNW